MHALFNGARSTEYTHCVSQGGARSAECTHCVSQGGARSTECKHCVRQGGARSAECTYCVCQGGARSTECKHEPLDPVYLTLPSLLPSTMPFSNLVLISLVPRLPDSFQLREGTVSD